CVKGIISW
nr:immunoglobulin heavy chain junction region [Macaca mulatta]MOW49146.1 immunoglobulin heavy chain junction region [Macaca mulatta]MOW49198.1 immunoglobulin heavy chain junction region [Macaca mulatta]MOW50202.1 immunoglobulin heavy chain junction region [Macaca mulatta]MOW50741.1 immunoglobulin heavy chain junction region [Macaca mulatta]